MRLLLRVLAGLLLAVGVPLVMFMPVPVNADAPASVGWWFKVNQAPQAPIGAPAPVPVEVPDGPPNVPEGGLYIANDPTGPAAVSAVNLPADEGATGTFTLNIADGGAGAPLIAACPAVGVWEPTEGGAWADKPEADCAAGKILGELAADGTTVTFALDTSVAAPAGAGYDLVLLPDPDSGTPFSTPFEAPGSDAWAPVGGTSADETSTDTGSLESSPVSETSESFDTTGAPVDSGSSDFATDFAGGGDEAALDTSTPSPGAEIAPRAPPTAGDAAGQQQAAPAQTVADDDTSTERLTAIALLVALAAGLFWVSSRQPTSARSGVAGVGRFARARSGLPNRLT